MKLYIYRYNLSDNSFELIQILPNTDSFSKIAGKSKLWARYILREGATRGWYRKELSLSTTPLDTNKSCLMNQEELTDLVSKLQQKKKRETNHGYCGPGHYKQIQKLFPAARTRAIRSCARALNVSQTPIKHDAIINAEGIYKIVSL